MRSYCRRVTHPIIIIIIPFVWENVGALGEERRGKEGQREVTLGGVSGAAPAAGMFFYIDAAAADNANAQPAGTEGGRERERMMPSLPCVKTVVVGCSCCEERERMPF